ncbi:hypothetical protein D3C76_802780 [compost metagenome]
MCRAISSAPPSIDGHSKGRVTLLNTPQRLQPSVRADSSSEVSTLRKVAATGRKISGYLDRAMTRIAPPRPSKSELSDTQVKLLTNEGTANGRHSTTPHSRRPGRLLRSSSQARARPTTMHTSVTPNMSIRVLRIRPQTNGRQSRCRASRQPASQAFRATYSSGSKLIATRNSTGSTTQIEGRLRRGTKRTGDGSDRAAVIRANRPRAQAPGLPRHCQGRPGRSSAGAVPRKASGHGRRPCPCAAGIRRWSG